MKFRYFSILFFLTLLLSACNTKIEPKEHLGEIYSVALDSIMEQDEALSSEMKYIAIDTSIFEEVDETDKEEILSSFKKKYKVDVMDATFEQLKEKGLFNHDTMSLDGVLLKFRQILIITKY